MDSRLRLIISVIVAVIAVGAMWVLLVAPERSKASNLLSQIVTEQAARSAADAQVQMGEQARSGYPREVRWLSRLGRAVPQSDDLPQLIDTIDSFELGHRIDYTSTSFGAGGGGGFPGMTVSFSWAGDYLSLQSLLSQFDHLTVANGSNVQADGRLATINSVTLAKGTATVSMSVYQAVPPTAVTGLSTTAGASAASAAAGTSGATGTNGAS
jgi:hypothetical protein